MWGNPSAVRRPPFCDSTPRIQRFQKAACLFYTRPSHTAFPLFKSFLSQCSQNKCLHGSGRVCGLLSHLQVRRRAQENTRPFPRSRLISLQVGYPRVSGSRDASLGAPGSPGNPGTADHVDLTSRLLICISGKV